MSEITTTSRFKFKKIAKNMPIAYDRQIDVTIKWNSETIVVKIQKLPNSN